MSGAAAIAASIAFISAESSETTFKPRFEITTAGDPSPAITPSTTCRANLSVNSLLLINSMICATSFTEIKSAGETARSLAILEISPSHQDLALVGSDPNKTVSSTVSSNSALIIAAISLSGTPHAVCNLFLRSAGFSGNCLRSFSIQVASGATGTKSGSGKYR